MDSITIKSAQDSTILEFWDYDGYYCSVKLHSLIFSGTLRFWLGEYLLSDPVDFFNDLATHWQGWSDLKKWMSLEGELSLSAKSDLLGHIALSVELDQEQWSLLAVLILEAGQLEAIALQMKNFFKPKIENRFQDSSSNR